MGDGESGTGVSRRAIAVAAVLLLIGVAVTVALLVGGVVVGLFLVDSGPDTPDAQFEFERDGDDVVVTHVGGPSLDGMAVWVVVDGSKPGTWSNFESGGDRITEGDEIRIRNVDSGSEIRLEWSPPDGSEPGTIATYRVP